MTHAPTNRLRSAAPALVLLALAATAYHDLALWDPRSHGYPAVVGWFFEASDSSPQVVFAIVAGLLFRRRALLREALGAASAPAPGALCLALGVACQLWAQWVDAPDFEIYSLGLVGLGAGFVLGGRPLARELAPPLALLALAIPIPGALHNHLVFPFQIASTRFAGAALDALGFDVVRHATMLLLDGREFEVIETCSGLRSTMTLALLAGAWAVWFRTSLAHSAVLLAASLPIAFLTNGLRVMVLVVDPRPEVHEAHTTQGIVMFLMGTVALSGVDRLMLRLQGKKNPAEAARATLAAGVAPRRMAAVGLALAVMAAAALVVPALRVAPRVLGVASKLPRDFAGWRSRPGPELGYFLGNTFFAKRSNLVYEREQQYVSAFLGWDDRRLRTRSLLSEKNSVPGAGWETESRSRVVLEPGGVPMESVLSRRFSTRTLTFYGYRGVADVWTEVWREVLALDQPGSPFARSDRAGLLRLSIVIGPGADAVPRAEARLRDFYAALARERVW